MTKLSAGNLADQKLLDKIDKLFTCGVGELVDLPQLVVVGDQSSGKSSVLEGLTQLPFPRDKELCTRFATQIAFRRSPVAGISASIIPSSSSSDKHKAHLRAWSRPNVKDLTPGGFSDIILEVQAHMGLGKDSTDALPKANFSEDIFKIEISGPTQDHLSIVDVPGIFRNVEDGKTTQNDKEMVRRMVRGYMENPRSVMLTVVPANVDTATQEILSMAKEFDPDGIRTLGVLTKPDLVDRGAEQSILDLANGIRYPLKLGWQILRNTGQADLATKGRDRNAAELRFFRDEHPWNSLDEDKYGVDSLRLKLQDILAHHIRREFPNVRNEIAKKLQQAIKAHQALGAQRSNAYDQRAYLTDIAIEYERLVNDALHKQYNTAVFDGFPELRLPTKLVTRQDEFAVRMDLSGHEYAFADENDSESETFDMFQSLGISPDSPPVKVKEDPEYPELEECIGESDATVASGANSGIIAWLDQNHQNSRGFELGSIDPNLLNTVLREQTQKWEPIARGYVSDVIETVHGFILTALRKVVPDSRVQEALLLDMRGRLCARYKAASDNVRFLLDVERTGIPITANHYFNENLQKARKTRHAAMLSRLDPTATDKEGNKKYIAVEDVERTLPMSNKEHVILDFHDVLKAYYKVALKRFVDCVSQQAAVWHLVSGPESPLKLFSAAYVSRLTDDQLAEIAGEDPMVKQKRKTLQREIKKLNEGKKIL